MLTMSQDFPKHMGCSCFDEAHSLVKGYPCNQVTRYLKMHVHINRVQRKDPLSLPVRIKELLRSVLICNRHLPSEHTGDSGDNSL